MTRIHLRDTTEAVGYISAKVAETIHAAYVHRVCQGDERPSALVTVGVRLIEEYRRTYGI